MGVLSIVDSWWTRGRREAVAALAFFVMFATVVGPFGLVPAARAQSSSEIGSWADLVAFDADGSTASTIELEPGLYVLSDTVEIPEGGAILGLGDTAWEPSLLGSDAGGTLVDDLCDPAAARSAVTICATGGGNGPGFSAFSVPSGSATVANLTITGADTNDNGGAINVAEGARLDLNDSFIVGNSANEGGGLYNAGTAVIRRSTFQANVASRKGGGIENNGTASLVNSTLSQNVGKGGGGISTAGTAYLSFVTVYTNQSTNKIGAGTLRNGGTLIVKNSIVANNMGSDGEFHDCSGTPDFIGVNLVSSAQGCNPGSDTIDLSTEPGAPILNLPGPGDYGGATPTHPLSEEDAGAVYAVNAASSCTVLDESGFDDPYANGDVGTDQRGRARTDGQCDVGSFEISLGLDVELSTSAPSVEVGAVTVPLENLPAALAAAETAGTTSSTQLSAIQLSAIQLSAIQLSAIQLSAIQLSAIPLSTQLSAIQLSAIQLSAISTADGESVESLLVGTKYEGIPLQALTLADLLDAQPGLTLADIDFRSTQLSAIQLSAIVLVQLPLEVVQLSAINTPDANREAWCDYLGLTPAQCVDLDMSSSLVDLAAAGRDNTTLDSTQLSAIQLSAIQLSAIATVWTQLSAIQLSAIQLSAIQLSAIDWASTQLSAIELDAAQLSAIGCAGGCVPGVTLGELGASGAIDDSTIADLIGLFSTEPLLSSDYSLADLLYGLIEPTAIAWEELGDLASLPLADASDNTSTSRGPDGAKQPSFDYVITLDAQGPTSSIDVGLELPAGFSFARPDGTVADPSIPLVRLDGAPDGSLVPAAFDSSGTCLTSGDLVFLDLQLTEGMHVLEVPIWAGVDLGEFEASVTACAEAGTQTAAAGPASTSIMVTAGAPSSTSITSSNLELSHIDESGEIQQYEFELTSRSQARIILGNLGEDLDLVLFGPPMQDPLRQTPQVGYGLVEDFAYDLTPDDDALDPNALEDLPLDPPAGAVVHAVSANRGLTDELLDTGALTPGTYTIQVSGYNGATTDQAFTLRLRTTPLIDVTCTGTPLGINTSDGDPATPTGVNTVFLYNATTYAGTGLETLINDPRWSDLGISPAVVAVDEYDAVATEFNQWTDNPCDPLAANDVVRSIGSAVLDPILAANPDLEYVVIVGDDHEVPFARMTDGVFVSNEAVHGLTQAEDGALKASLAEGYYQSDDPYASDRGIAVADREFFVPTLAIGRLVETFDDVEGAISSFLANDGLLTDGSASGTALVAGYDFLADGSAEVAAQLAQDFTVTSLISETWDSEALTAALDDQLSIASINAHFDESRLLPANENLAGTETDLFTVSDWLALLEGQPYFVFSMGCHAALSVPDSQLDVAVTDWAQAAAQTGSAWLGNTGFGYGDTQVVALSERLSALYAERVGSTTIGKALVGAKQEYASSLYTITPYDIKVLEEFTLYGLPMARTVGSSASPAAFNAATPAADPVVFSDPITGLNSSLMTLGYGQLTTSEQTTEAWKGLGLDLLTVQGRAILPQDTINVSVEGMRAAGVLVTGLTSSAKEPFSPVIFDPQPGEQYTPNSITEDFRVIAGETTFPASVQSSVRRALIDDQQQDRVVIVPARHYTESGSSDIEFFTDIELQTLYRPDGWTDAEAKPFIQQSVGRYGSEVVHFDITVVPPSEGTVERVLVLFREDGASGPWSQVDLANVPNSDQWLGGRPRPSGSTATAFEYVVQAVSNWGDVSIASGKAINFDTISPQLNQGVTVTVSESGTQTLGWYPGRDGSDVVAIATSSSPLCSYILDGEPSGTVPADGLIPIDGDGGHLLQVFAGDDCQAPTEQGLLFVAIDGTAPQSEAVVTGTTVSIAAFDPFGSGVEKIEYRLDDGPPIIYSGPIALSKTTTITYRAVDFVGNIEDEKSITVTIDTTPPTLNASATADSAPYPSGEWTNATSVTVTVTATDSESGVTSLTVDGTEAASDATGAPSLSTNVEPITTEGTTPVRYAATDAAGNASSESTFVVKIDRTPPTATLTLPTFTGSAAEGSYTCGDALSGLASCTVTVGTDTYSTDSGGVFPLPAGSIGNVLDVTLTATDLAGNTFSASDVYGKQYGYCYLYDPDKTTSGAVAIKIRITTNTWDVQLRRDGDKRLRQQPQGVRLSPRWRLGHTPGQWESELRSNARVPVRPEARRLHLQPQRHDHHRTAHSRIHDRTGSPRHR